MVRVCCRVYVYRSGGRRSEADRTRYKPKIEEKETHARARTAVAQNIRYQAYRIRPAPRRDSGQGGSRRGIVLCGSRSERLSVYRTRLGVGLGAVV